MLCKRPRLQLHERLRHRQAHKRVLILEPCNEGGAVLRERRGLQLPERLHHRPAHARVRGAPSGRSRTASIQRETHSHRNNLNLKLAPPGTLKALLRRTSRRALPASGARNSMRPSASRPVG